MSAIFLQAFDLASSDTRQQVICSIVEHLSDDELRCFQDALQRLKCRFDILCGVSKSSGASMPHEIQLQIIDLLDITDLYYCTNVCREWRQLFRHCELLTDDLLKKWFPALSDEGRDKSQLLYQAIRGKHFRDTGRFRSRQRKRFTCGFFKQPNGLFPVDRVEGLQRGRMFKDLTCSASISCRPSALTLLRRRAPDQTEPASDLTAASQNTPYNGPGGSVKKCFYAHGRLAWQLTPASMRDWAHPIFVHDFHAHRRWELSLPSMRTRGIRLALWAIGRDLAVANVVGERVLYAWDLESHAVDRVTIQNPPYRCFTRYRSVVVATQSGQLLLWSFGHGLANIDLAVPQDEFQYRGPAKPEDIPRAPFSSYDIRNSRIMFHPREENVFFVATFDERVFQPDEALLLWVHEFRNRRCCRVFTYPVAPERREWIYFTAREIDANGTYQLLGHETPIDDGFQLSCVTFNTISGSFGALTFQAPITVDRDICFIWNEHLMLRQGELKDPGVRPCPLVALGQHPNPLGLEAGRDVVYERQKPEKAMKSMMTSVVWPKSVDSNALGTSVEVPERRKPMFDVIRTPDISPSTSCIGANVGLRYMLSTFGSQCNWEGLHVRDCPRSPGLQSSNGQLYPINYFAQDSSPYDFGGTAVAVLGDDGFLVVVVNSQDYYTVFAVDEDGKIAEAMRDGATENAEVTS